MVQSADRFVDFGKYIAVTTGMKTITSWDAQQLIISA